MPATQGAGLWAGGVETSPVGWHAPAVTTMAGASQGLGRHRRRQHAAAEPLCQAVSFSWSQRLTSVSTETPVALARRAN